MGAPQRYLFDISFDLPDLGGSGAGGAKAPRFTGADVEAARAEGIAEGREATLAAAAAATEARIAAAVEALGRGIDALAKARSAWMHETEQRATALLRAALGKAVPAFAAKDPIAEIEALVAGCLVEALDEPRIVLRVNDALFDAVQSRIAAIAKAGGYSGKVVLLADAALACGDGRVEWADGGAERDTRRIAQEIDAVLARALAAPPPCPSEENLNG
ncbi:MAG TPA: hypothetical protein VMU87_06575 [Stellaceae bacterium]|nr:hypothetical protein [Stellaceae bacterium]